MRVGSTLGSGSVRFRESHGDTLVSNRSHDICCGPPQEAIDCLTVCRRVHGFSRISLSIVKALKRRFRNANDLTHYF